MPRVDLEQSSLVALLDAARQVLRQLGGERMRREERGEGVPAELPRAYGEIRRLRDLLQRQVGQGAGAQLDLDAEDGDLLVACVARFFDLIEAAPCRNSKARAWHEEQIRQLIARVPELASHRVDDLPGAPPGMPASEARRELMVAVSRRFTSVESTGKVLVGGFGPAAGAVVEPRPVPPEPEPATPIELPLRAASPTPVADGDDGGGEDDADPDLHAPHAPHAPHAGPSPVLRDTSLPSDAGSSGGPATVGCPFDLRTLRDPRIRSLAGLYVRAFQRARAAQDLRFAAGHAFSLIEAITLDLGLARRAELGLVDSPDTWDLLALLDRILGEDLAASDHHLLRYLANARDLARPAVQLTRPMAVTRQTMEQFEELLGRLARVGGVSRSAQPSAPPGTA